MRLPTRPGTAPAVPVPAAPPHADWRSLLQQADAAYAENRFDEAIKLYDTALVGLEQDQTSDATTLKMMKAAAQKHRGLATFIPQRDKLPADKQIEATQERLKALNPDYDPRKGQLTISARRVVEASFPVNHADPSALRDISPLKGLPLRLLNLYSCRLTDISPLRGMPLEELSLNFNPLEDISPLKGMPLKALNLYGTMVTDITALRGMPI